MVGARPARAGRQLPRVRRLRARRDAPHARVGPARRRARRPRGRCRPRRPPPRTGDGYEVRLDAGTVRAGRESELAFRITRGGRPVETEPYLGAGGHLVALREGDLAFLHVHPLDEGAARFAATFPTEGRYRLFLQFKAAGRVHTAAFTQDVAAR